MLVVVRDQWIPDQYFEDDEHEEAETYASRCRRMYRGGFTIHRCDDNHPRRFLKAILGTPEANQ